MQKRSSRPPRTEEDPAGGRAAVFDPPAFEEGFDFFPSDLRATQTPSQKASCLHYHDDLEIGYCADGAGVFLVDGMVLPYQSPCASILCRDQLHIAQSSPSRPAKWVFVNFRTAAFFGERPELLRLLAERPEAGEHCLVTAEEPELLARVRDLIGELRDKRPRYRECARYLLAAVLIENARRGAPAGTREQRPDRWALRDISPAIDYISRHYREPVTAQALARACSVSPATLRRKFQAALGMSPLEYLHKVRITAAISMLALGGRSVLEIGSEAGYESPSSFSRQFRRFTGASPLEYRARGSCSMPREQ